MAKTYTLRFRAVDRRNFLEIKDGLKTVETRAATSKYKDVQKGDTLVFVCGKERMEKVVKKTAHFQSILAMTKAIPFKKVMPSVASVAEMAKIYKTYTGYEEKIKEFGIIAMYLV